MSTPEDPAVVEAPFAVGDRVIPTELQSWSYQGLTGRPGKDRHAVRRFTRGIWVLELFAHADRTRATRVVSIRTHDQDSQHWSETRQRLMRHRPGSRDGAER